jgi:dTDP-4-dehydrorhamnose 3,5-epimerase
VYVEPTALAGVVLIHLTPAADHRGSFARVFCADEFRAWGLNPHVAQCSLSHTLVRGTLRGMHYQKAPAQEAKLVRCVRGAAYYVAADLRPDSPTFRQWTSVELTAKNRVALYAAEGCAIGFQTLDDDTEMLYQISHPYVPALASGFRYDDPLIGIRWPLPPVNLSSRDLEWAPLQAQGGASRR